jgi:hypothetical protein
MASEYPALTKFFLDAIDRFANPRAQMYRTTASSISSTIQAPASYLLQVQRRRRRSPNAAAEFQPLNM